MELTVWIDEKAKLREGAEAYIKNMGLLGEKYVGLTSGETGGEFLKPGALIIDSIQTLFSESVESAPGSVSQLRECTAQLVRFAKNRSVATVLVGHVTKEGTLAGPRVLEHMVDTVLYFQSDVGSRFRIIRAVKNRFGAANELGFFVMSEQGFKEVKNPSAIFLAWRMYMLKSPPQSCPSLIVET